MAEEVAALDPIELLRQHRDGVSALVARLVDDAARSRLARRVLEAETFDDLELVAAEVELLAEGGAEMTEPGVYLPTPAEVVGPLFPEGPDA